MLMSVWCYSDVMEINDYADTVRDQLVAAASLGDERTQQIAATLAGTVESAVRLAVVEAISAAAREINSALFEASGGQPFPAVAVHLDHEEIHVGVSHRPTEAEEAPRSDEGAATARISLRLSESLKSDIEQAASSADMSVNTWLVRAAVAGVSQGTRHGQGWPAGPASWPAGPWNAGPARGSSRITGWVTG
jgi:predicted HicB family RNase H-like nuclease